MVVLVLKQPPSPEFGAIGNGLSFAIGVAAARKDGKTVLLEGDGSLLMHFQELETVRRHRLKLLGCTEQP
jgi:acetolactate synthase I/II/III large subunit